MPRLPSSFWDRHPTEVAAELIGCTLRMRQTDASIASGRIIETEAYHHSEGACHAYRYENREKSDRVAHFFGPAGVTYVYLNYGIHKLLNVITGPEEDGSAVLIRAIEPLAGLESIRANRDGVDEESLCNGPGKLCQALGIDLSHNKLQLQSQSCPISFFQRKPNQSIELLAGPRIGISKATELMWRFVEAESNFSQAKENKLLIPFEDALPMRTDR